MSQMIKTPESPEERKFTALAVRVKTTSNLVRRSERSKQADEARRKMANYILERVAKASRIEDLVRQEMTLQRLDLLAAETEEDRKSVESARTDYKQIDGTIRQMRRNPDEYFQGNMGMRDVGEDFKKFPRSKGLQQLAANRARFRNRAAFLPATDRLIWDARIKLADETERRLKKLHRDLARLFQRKREAAGLAKDKENPGMIRGIVP